MGQYQSRHPDWVKRCCGGPRLGTLCYGELSTADAATIIEVKEVTR